MATADYVICDEGANLCFSEVKLGIAPAVISEFLMHKCNWSHVSAWMISGLAFTPRQAETAGLVHSVVKPQEINREKDKILKNIFDAGPQAVRSTKKLLREIPELSQSQIVNKTTALIASLRAADEGQEGLKGFLEKREPSWRKR
jgi:methylglutaconyl-CoA hydratase